LAHECPSSILPAEHPISRGSEASDIGQAQHYGAGAIELGKPYDVVAIARSYSVDTDELAILLYQTAKAWGYLQRYFPNPRVEYRLHSELLGDGTGDIVEHNGDTAAVNDWKSGRVQRNYRWQLWGYAYDLRETLGMPRSGVIDSSTAWVRTGDIEMHPFSDAELDAMADEHRALESKIGEVYSPGEHCGFCRRRNECGAHASAIRAAATALMPLIQALSESIPYGLTSIKLAHLYPQAKLLEKALTNYNEMLKASLADSIKLAVGDGRILYLAEVQRTQLDPTLAIATLEREQWTQDEIMACVEVSKGRVEDIAEAQGRATKVRGAIKAAREKILTQLEQSGAVSKVIQQRLTIGKAE
jgi:hypothetical protein